MKNRIDCYVSIEEAIYYGNNIYHNDEKSDYQGEIDQLLANC
jgi:hypothetical protein